MKQQLKIYVYKFNGESGSRWFEIYIGGKGKM